METIKTRKAATWSRPIVGPDGECKRSVEVFSYPWIDDKTGQLKGVIEYSRDITERVKAEEARKLTEERLQTFLNSTQDVVFLKDEQFRFSFVNGATCDLLGRKEEEIIGKFDAELYPEGMAERIRKADLRALKGQRSPADYRADLGRPGLGGR